MESVNKLLFSNNYSEETIRKVKLKKTEKGALAELSTLKAFSEAYKDSEDVFLKIYDVRRRKANDKCNCGAPISRWYERLGGTYKFRCKLCGLICSPLVNTPLSKSHKPLNETLLLAYMLFQSKHGLTAAETKRLLGYKYESCLNQLRRVRMWMALALDLLKFDEEKPVEMDETYVKIPTGMGNIPGISFTRGLGSERIKPVFTIVENGGSVAKGYVISSTSKEYIKPIVEREEIKGKVYTDGAKVYNFLPKDTLMKCNHKKKQWSTEGAHVNTCESLNSFIKNSIGFVHKGVSEEHMQGYVDSVCFTFSNRHKDANSAIESLFEALPALNERGKMVPNEKYN